MVSLEKEGVEFGQTDALFLSEDGHPIKKTSIEKDFERLVKAAGLKDTQACLSMFRHRFITMEVIVHLKEFMTAGAKTMQMMTRVDYESILKRVATKTGHGSVESLWHYIDLAWDEIGVWGGADQALERFRAVESLFDDLIALDHEIKYGNSSPEDKLKWVRERLSEIISNTNHGLKRDTLT